VSRENGRSGHSAIGLFGRRSPRDDRPSATFEAPAGGAAGGARPAPSPTFGQLGQLGQLGQPGQPGHIGPLGQFGPLGGVGPRAGQAPTGDGGGPGPTAYATSPYRPAVQLGVRIALWVALAVGGAGGVVALLGLSDGRAEATDAAPADTGDAATSVPAPVAGTAELAVEEWLTATPEDEEVLDGLFVEPVTLPAGDGDGDGSSDGGEGGALDVLELTTVAGHPIQDGYWVVTLQADVVEYVEGQAQTPATWFVEVGVVGDPDGGLAALSTPGIMPAPPVAAEGWRSARPSLETPDDDDALATTVEAFLDALLTGQADPAPYLAPDADIPIAGTPPFADVDVDGIAAEEQEGGGGAMQVWVDVVATLPAGRLQPVSYELVVTPRADRWEIAALWGAPSLGRTPSDQG
jgi:Conjugative transposon protein TcpC